MPEYSKGEVIAIGAIFAFLPVFAVALRFFARNLIRANYGVDDFLILPAAVSETKYEAMGLS